MREEKEPRVWFTVEPNEGRVWVKVVEKRHLVKANLLLGELYNHFKHLSGETMPWAAKLIEVKEYLDRQSN